ncbi:diaminopimelate epimerase [Thermodesulfobacteriota bacterium]
MEINFVKMHGTLNDFVVFHDLTGAVEVTPKQVAAICDRRGGIGADGLIAVRPSEKAQFFMDYINADGSLAEMCGNGIRCLAKYVFDNGLIERTTLEVETRAGVKTLSLLTGTGALVERVQVDMGPPIFDPREIPVNLESDGKPILDHPVEAQGKSFRASMLSMGNPHCVIVMEEDVEPLPKLFGPSIETHPIFPAKTNVEFIRVVNRNHLIMRVWERGSGETFACGTGACAAAVAANLKGFVDAECKVSLLGGDLDIDWKGPGHSVLMTGDARTVFQGTIDI